ncbi:unnamed protein product [Euphydryas editha]|uniref:CCHC-type domain-containing protein n=1 Tax=Euphydryas editha TaxID=104508 RepID=A0AAU9TDC4_EUPED|nr:unnamed protein product [Euphydryas editha]
MACDPKFRKALLEKGKVYIGWEVVTVDDYTTAICCRRCQLYGHGEGSCKAEAPTCGKCGETGHKIEECKANTAKCATCSKFGHSKEAASHITASVDCPARQHAEKRMVGRTAY